MGWRHMRMRKPFESLLQIPDQQDAADTTIRLHLSRTPIRNREHKACRAVYKPTRIPRLYSRPPRLALLLGLLANKYPLLHCVGLLSSLPASFVSSQSPACL